MQQWSPVNWLELIQATGRLPLLINRDRYIIDYDRVETVQQLCVKQQQLHVSEMWPGRKENEKVLQQAETE